MSTFAPGVSRDCPSVTTCSPATRPESTMVRSPIARPATMVRMATTLSGPTTKTYEPVLTGHDRPRRHGDDVRLHLELHGQPDVLARPERVAGVSESGFRRHRPGERVDGVVEKRQRADVADHRTVAAGGGHRDVAPRGAAAQLLEVSLRHRKAHQDRLELIDHDERRAAGLDEIALADEQAAGASGDRRA